MWPKNRPFKDRIGVCSRPDPLKGLHWNLCSDLLTIALESVLIYSLSRMSDWKWTSSIHKGRFLGQNGIGVCYLIITLQMLLHWLWVLILCESNNVGYHKHHPMQRTCASCLSHNWSLSIIWRIRVRPIQDWCVESPKWRLTAEERKCTSQEYKRWLRVTIVDNCVREGGHKVESSISLSHVAHEF